jgi:hypothetical protein
MSRKDTQQKAFSLILVKNCVLCLVVFILIFIYRQQEEGGGRGVEEEEERGRATTNCMVRERGRESLQCLWCVLMCN